MKQITILALGTLLSLNSALAFSQYECDKIIKKDSFTICYNYELKNPLWSKASLKASNLKKKGYSRKGLKFKEDPSLPQKTRSTLKDYKYSGWDRGHAISNDDLNDDRRSQKQTFYLSNIMPQAPKVNRGIYRLAEKLTRKLIIKSKGTGVVVAGGIYDPLNLKRIGPGRIAVPNKIYRFVALPDGKKYAFVFPNKNIDLGKKPSKYQVSIQELNRLTGFDFRKTTK